MLNKQSGNMYPWVTHTWNPIKGRCPHQCSYCYMKRFPVGELRLDTKCFKDHLGHGNIIFVGSSCDIFAEQVPEHWIKLMFRHIRDYPENTYLLQTRNPGRLSGYILNDNIIVGTTIETNRDYPITKAPTPEKRYQAIQEIIAKHKMVSIEPILDFDVDVMVQWIQNINPDFVSIGADSKNNGLPEPTLQKIHSLISQLEESTEIKIKSNLNRVFGQGDGH
ncbi:MAG: DUF5131 family protein [Candidatus Thermoplasmatota archaeon]|nr:DUF5131 family protein [Candidatus Thermoplasmatota archaeon]MBU1940981.1 DUF5131 family protein [Candidatus Thermoplasmatota archaeon]